MMNEIINKDIKEANIKEKKHDKYMSDWIN